MDTQLQWVWFAENYNLFGDAFMGIVLSHKHHYKAWNRMHKTDILENFYTVLTHGNTTEC